MTPDHVGCGHAPHWILVEVEVSEEIRELNRR